jgi:hypothetical protein
VRAHGRPSPLLRTRSRGTVDADLSDDRIQRVIELLVGEFYGDFRGRYEGFWYERERPEPSCWRGRSTARQ